MTVYLKHDKHVTCTTAGRRWRLRWQLTGIPSWRRRAAQTYKTHAAVLPAPQGTGLMALHLQVKKYVFLCVSSGKHGSGRTCPKSFLLFSIHQRVFRSSISVRDCAFRRESRVLPEFLNIHIIRLTELFKGLRHHVKIKWGKTDKSICWFC